MSEPLVSILIPCYNAAEWVGTAIESALSQTWKKKEIIVIDDGSTDESWQVINSYVPAIHAEYQSNQGAFNTRNLLLLLARGEWIQYLDADDELAADKIEVQLRNTSQVDAMYGSMRLEWFEGRKLIRQCERPAQNGTDEWIKWFGWEYPNPSACLFRKKALEEIHGWDHDYLLCEDYALYVKLLQAGRRFAPTPQAWSNYRQWSPNQLVNKHSTELARTRLRLMLSAAKELEAAGRLTAERSHAFQTHAFQTVRCLYCASPEIGMDAMADLQRRVAQFVPPAGSVSAAYRILYNFLGFAGTERIASWRRRFVPPKAA